MKALSLYSGGCDGLTLAGSWCGIESIAFCECDKACREKIRKHHPRIQRRRIFRYDTEVTHDALRATGIDPGEIDIILASPPCQCASVAGKRMGAADERNRWPEFLRIVRDIRPRRFMAENVPGLLSIDDGRLYGDILRQLDEMGYFAEWGVFGARDVGAPHKRERLFIVGHYNGGGCGEPGICAEQPRGTEAIGAGKGMADSARAEQNRTVGNENAAGRGGFANVGIVGDASRAGREERNAPTVAGGARYVAGECAVEPLGDSERSRRTRDHRRRASAEPADGYAHGGLQFKPGLGMLLNGVLDRLAAQRWPAGRGEQQYEWEPPRVGKPIKGRPKEIEMLGNAVVPQWAYIVLAVIAEMEGIGHERDL